MKAYIFGLGSIGQRHLRLLKKRDPEMRVIAVQTRKRRMVIHDDLSVDTTIDPAEFYGVESISPENFDGEAGDVAFVCNPISMHVGTAMLAASRGLHVFVEKPLSHTFDGVETLASEFRKWGTTCYVGYNMRFHPAVLKLASILRSEELGKIHGATLHFGEYLPTMHPYEDYRATHMARRSEGGGAVLSLSHEVDLARFFFGEPAQVTGFSGKYSDLEIDTDDTLEASLLIGGPRGEFPVHLGLNFLDRPPRRYAEINGSEGSVVWTYHTNEIVWFRPGREPDKMQFPGFRRNQMFEDQLDHFFDCTRNKATPFSPLSEGAKTLRLCLRLLSISS